MSKAYIFVDGAAFEESISGFLEYFGATIKDVNWATLSKGADRIFYFDSLPEKTIKETDEEFQIKLTTKRELFSYLRRIPNMHVREGFTRVRQKRGNNPQLTQKGVDIALAVEVLTHAHSGNIDEARIFTNDLDFYPLLDALTNTRVKTLLYFIGKKTAPELPEVADVAEEIGLFTVCTWLSSPYRDKYTIEGRNSDDESEGRVLVKEGTGAFGKCELYQIGKTGKFLLCGLMGDRGEYQQVSNSAEFLVSHFASTAAFPIDWKSVTIPTQSEQ